MDLLFGRNTGTFYTGDDYFKDLYDRISKLDEKTLQKQTVVDANNKKYFDKIKRNVNFRIGEEVLVQDFSGLRVQSRKFGNVWKKGVVKDKINFHVYLIQLEGLRRTIKVNERKIKKIVLQKFSKTSSGQVNYPVVEEDEEEDALEEDLEDLDEEEEEEIIMELSDEDSATNEVTKLIHPGLLSNEEIKQKLIKENKTLGSKADNRLQLEAEYFIKRSNRNRRR